jgi:hypothetical protein
MYCPFISKNKRQARIGSDAYLIDIERKKVISNGLTRTQAYRHSKKNRKTGIIFISRV